MTAKRRRVRHGTLRIASAALLFLGLNTAAAGQDVTLKIPGAQIEPVDFVQIEGWAEDDHAAAFATFLNSCRPILRGTAAMRAARPVYGALYEACRRAVELKSPDIAAARAFFESNFRAVQIAPLGESDGFVTGYYEPVVAGSREPSDEYAAPLYRRPPNLLKGGRMAVTRHVATKGKGKGNRKGKRAVRRIVPFHDRAAIEDGALAGRDLEIVYLKDPVDEFFSHIQGSVRVRLEDGETLRLNYAATNGQPYTAVGRYLIERDIIPKDEMSMDRIREWMEANPEEGRELRRRNRSFVFFRETNLAADEEAIGAQGISLTAWRSIAVDRRLHVYGTPFFISAELPIDGEDAKTPFRRLMVAQDTGGAIVGPARADIYFGAGKQAGHIAGRLRHPARFFMLVPNEIDPVAETAKAPLPVSRPADPDAKLPEAAPGPKADAAVDPEAGKPDRSPKP